MGEYVLTLLAAATVTYLLTPAVRRLAVLVGALHAPRSRDVHVAPTPLLGGFAIYVGLAAGLLVASRMPALTGAFAEPNMVKGLLLAGGLVVVMGFVDDRWGLGAISKLAGQVAAGVILVWSGAEVTWLPWPGSNTLGLTSDQQVAATILVVVVTINAVNFIDGLDGLATGIVGIGAAAFFVYYYTLTHRLGLPDQTGPALASAVLVGVCLGFLPHNFYPARIFMGDTGAMLLGLLLAYAPISSLSSLDPGSLTDHAAYAAGTVNRFGAFVPLLLPAAIMLIPYADLLMAVVRRTRAGTSPFSADMKHLHHRLMAIGHSHRTAVLIMYLWAALFAGAVAWLSIVRTSLWILIIVTGAAGALLVLLFVSLPRLRPWARAAAAKSPAGAVAGPQAPALAPVHVAAARPRDTAQASVTPAPVPPAPVPPAPVPPAPVPPAPVVDAPVPPAPVVDAPVVDAPASVAGEAQHRQDAWAAALEATAAAPHPGQPAPYPGERAAFRGEPTPFPDERAAFRGEATSFPDERAAFRGKATSFPDERAPFSGESVAFPREPATHPDGPTAFPGEHTAGPAATEGPAASSEPGWSSWFTRDVPPSQPVDPAPWPGFGPEEPAAFGAEEPAAPAPGPDRRAPASAQPPEPAEPAPPAGTTPGWPDGEAAEPEAPTDRWSLPTFPDADPRLPASLQDRR